MDNYLMLKQINFNDQLFEAPFFLTTIAIKFTV